MLLLLEHDHDSSWFQGLLLIWSSYLSQASWLLGAAAGTVAVLAMLAFPV